MSGVLTTVLNVTLNAPGFNAPENAEVTLDIGTISEEIPKFYISRREIRGDSVKLVCKCRMSWLDRPVNISQSEFDENGEIHIDTVLARIGSEIDVGGGVWYDESDVIAQRFPKLHKDFVFGCNCLTLLEKISAAFVGYFRIWQNTLLFVPWGVPFMSRVFINQNTPISVGLKKTIRKIIVKGGGETFERGDGSFRETLVINTPLSSDNLVSYLYNRLYGKEYFPVNAAGFSDHFPKTVSEVTFENGSDIYGDVFLCNNIKVYPSRSGLFIKASNNDINESEWDYSSISEREADKKIAVGERVGNFSVSPEGEIKITGDTQTGVIKSAKSEKIGNEFDDSLIIGGLPEIHLKADRITVDGMIEPSGHTPGLLTQSKDIVGAINEVFTLGGEGGNPWEADPDWEAFNALPEADEHHYQFLLRVFDNSPPGSPNYFGSVAAFIWTYWIDGAHLELYLNDFEIDWGDGSPIERFTPQDTRNGVIMPPPSNPNWLWAKANITNLMQGFIIAGHTYAELGDYIVHIYPSEPSGVLVEPMQRSYACLWCEQPNGPYDFYNQKIGIIGAKIGKRAELQTTGDMIYPPWAPEMYNTNYKFIKKVNWEGGYYRFSYNQIFTPPQA
jgi:hypothetical protein